MDKLNPQKPAIGRIVHYVIPSGPHKGAHRPAIITAGYADGLVNLTIFTDQEDDMLFDCNGGINTIEQWQRDVLPHLLPKRSYGWCPTHCWKIARPSKEAGHA